MPRAEIFPFEKIPKEIRPAWEFLRQKLSEHDMADLIKPEKTRVSLRRGQTRYLKYDYDDQQWVFCKDVAGRMDHIDPKRVCIRTHEGTRSQNACAIYRNNRLDPLYPILEQLITLVVADLKR